MAAKVPPSLIDDALWHEVLAAASTLHGGQFVGVVFLGHFFSSSASTLCAGGSTVVFPLQPRHTRENQTMQPLM
jgi:hypothetical protein